MVNLAVREILLLPIAIVIGCIIHEAQLEVEKKNIPLVFFLYFENVGSIFLYTPNEIHRLCYRRKQGSGVYEKQ